MYGEQEKEPPKSDTMMDRDKLRDLEFEEWQLFKRRLQRPRNSCKDADCR